MNLSAAGVTVPSVVSLETRPISTSAVGWLVSTTVKLAVLPASVVVSPAVGVTTVPAVSSSVFVSTTSPPWRLWYWRSPLIAAAVTMRYTMGPSATLSSAPVTVTACGAFQVAAVKVTLAGATVPSPVSLELRSIVTSAEGWDVSTTANVAVPPASVVVRPAVGETTMRATSLSRLLTATSSGSTPA